MQFVETLPNVERTRRTTKWDDLAETLVAHRGQWGVVEEDAKLYRAQMTRSLLEKRGSFEVKYRKGTVYARAL